MEQLSHYQAKNLTHHKSIVILCDKLQSAANLGSIFRISEAFGVEKLYISNDNEIMLESNRFKKTARSTFKYVDYSFYDEPKPIFSKYKKEGYQTIAIESCDHSSAMNSMIFSTQLLLVIGHENYGISYSILELCEDVAHISLYGKNSSINVSQALAITLFQSVNQKS